MTEPSIDLLMTKTSNKFLLSNALSKRAQQITDGSLPYVDDFNPANPILTAMKEIAAEKIKLEVHKGPVPKMEKMEREEISRLSSLVKEKKAVKKKKK